MFFYKNQSHVNIISRAQGYFICLDFQNKQLKLILAILKKEAALVWNLVQSPQSHSLPTNYSEFQSTLWISS